GIGIGAERDQLRPIAGPAQFLFEELGGIWLVIELALEIEARRMAEIGMGRTGKAIDAAMLAAAIWIDRLIEGHIRRVIAGDDRLAGIEADRGTQRRQVVFLVLDQPAIILQRPVARLETTRTIGDGPAPLARPGMQGRVGRGGEIAEIETSIGGWF